MAKYVVLAFDSNDEADAFVSVCNETGIVGVFAHEMGRYVRHFTPLVRAVYQKPTKFCDCTDGKNRKFTRGKKYGWWVHTICGKPTRAWAEGHEWFRTLGRNLLPKTPAAPEYRGDGTWGMPHGEPVK